MTDSASLRAAGVTGSASVRAAGVIGSVGVQAAPTPSPTLGSNSPAPNPPGSADSSPQDYKGAVWIVLAVLVVAALVGGGTLYLSRSRRMDMNPRSSTDDAAVADEKSTGEHRTEADQDAVPNRDRTPVDHHAATGRDATHDHRGATNRDGG
ncbi:MAG: hypothetical protein HOV67_16325 [Kribbellaceae bacterium]|nr:hypothetical protein [Kribbellaceae bacterium]